MLLLAGDGHQDKGSGAASPPLSAAQLRTSSFCALVYPTSQMWGAFTYLRGLLQGSAFV